MNNPVVVIPDGHKALLALAKAGDAPGLPPTIIKLAHLRASQINGCSACTAIHARELRDEGETDERIFSVAAWRDATWFTDAERAALDLTEAVTRIADQADPVPDAIWNEATRHFDETASAALLIQIALINAFNRLNAAVRQPIGTAELELVMSQIARTREPSPRPEIEAVK